MNLALKPNLWQNICINKMLFRRRGIQEFLMSRRFSKVNTLDFFRIQLKEEELSSLMNWLISSKVVNINLYGNNISNISPCLLSESLNNLKTINLDFTKL